MKSKVALINESLEAAGIPIKFGGEQNMGFEVRQCDLAALMGLEARCIGLAGL